jgi:glycosyltransferase involved in cell wall biosynthesis
MLSWEYPPKIVGGIARHVEELSWSLAKNPDLEVHVVTCDFPGAPAEEVTQGVHIHRVAPYEAPGGYADFVHWVHQLNAAMHDRAQSLIEEWLTPKRKGAARKDPKKLKEADGIILHAHDWLAFFSGVRLKHAYKLPLVATIHATEHGRNSGIHSDISRYIDSIERDLVAEAWRVIVCTKFMEREVNHALHAPFEKMDIIYNGIVRDKFEFDFPAEEAQAFRDRFALPYEKIVMFVGRGVREKGAQVLIEALPKIRIQHRDTKLVIAGGGSKQHLMDQATALGVGSQTFFTGFIPDDDLLRLYRVADVACFPSLYEPFGIVALEAMASKTPVVVSDAGGLPEVIEADVTGTVTWAGNAESLAWGIVRAIKDPAFAKQMAERAYEKVQDVFNWDLIADQTNTVYQRVWSEYRKSDW